VAKKLEVEAWTEVLVGPFDLAPPNDQNLPDWLGVVDSWAFTTADTLGALTSTALEVLLETEAEVERAIREGVELPPAPKPASSPAQYTTLVIGQERERQKKLGWWDRFQLADGFVPGAARFAVAAGLLVPAMLFSGTAGDATVTVYNGLGIPVEVSIDGEHARVEAHGWTRMDVATNANAEVVARTESGREIERFHADTDDAWVDYVYNVASASPLVEWTATYGNAAERPERPLGTVRWHRASATHASSSRRCRCRCRGDRAGPRARCWPGEAVSGLSPVVRGHALVMGIVLLGEAAPEQWRRDARALLFTRERPYFR